MKRQLKQTWINALRSGGFKQGRNRLKTERNDGTCEYCCLGVLCEISPDVTFTVGYNAVPETAIFPSGFESLGSLAESWRNAIGMTEWQQEKLVDFNDNEHWSFIEIADWIEEHIDDEEPAQPSWIEVNINDED